tara:strand:+ start:5093 stop:6235 length:1143 start_codon:yes stop_codon:yes gene_type:complete
MRNVSILGIGQIPVAKRETASVGAMAVEACRRAMVDARVDAVDAVFVGNMMASEITGQSHLGPLVAAELGDGGCESVMVNAACASGAAAIRQAYLAVASGEHDTVIAVGVEKMTGTGRSQITRLLASAADYEREVKNHASFVGLNALLMQRYLHQYHLERHDFAKFAEVAHENALANPNARLRERVTPQIYLNCRMVSDPIALFDCCPTGDGAAAVVVSKRSRRKNAVHIRGSVSVSDTLSLQERGDPLWLRAAEESCRDALRQANRELNEIDFFEPHDAFTIMTVLSLEACGFAERGRGTEFAREVGIHLKGGLPLCTAGGLKARGHPVGATGAYQVVEAVQQLRGEAGPNQLDSPSVALTQSFGGTAATVVTHVLERG